MLVLTLFLPSHKQHCKNLKWKKNLIFLWCSNFWWKIILGKQVAKTAGSIHLKLRKPFPKQIKPKFLMLYEIIKI